MFLSFLSTRWTRSRKLVCFRSVFRAQSEIKWNDKQTIGERIKINFSFSLQMIYDCLMLSHMQTGSPCVCWNKEPADQREHRMPCFIALNRQTENLNKATYSKCVQSHCHQNEHITLCHINMRPTTANECWSLLLDEYFDQSDYHYFYCSPIDRS